MKINENFIANKKIIDVEMLLSEFKELIYGDSLCLSIYYRIENNKIIIDSDEDDFNFTHCRYTITEYSESEKIELLDFLENHLYGCDRKNNVNNHNLKLSVKSIEILKRQGLI